ncbi:MAG: HEAT repeat domain-containing protein, partial [Myxococcales bacterium]|nr:HEAT repeat domain-containing protein [Myxococcales bacterium]
AHRAWDVRAHAARLLSRVGDAEALQALRWRLPSEHDSLVLGVIREALGEPADATLERGEP